MVNPGILNAIFTCFLLSQCAQCYQKMFRGSFASKAVAQLTSMTEDGTDTSGFPFAAQMGLTFDGWTEWPSHCSFAGEYSEKKRHRYNKTRIPNWTCKGTESFQIIRNIGTILLKSGDIEVNPGPVQNPCSVCSKAVARNHRHLDCAVCAKSCHIGVKCGRVAVKDYEGFKNMTTYLWTCPICESQKDYVNSMANLPFLSCDILPYLDDDQLDDECNDSQNASFEFQDGIYDIRVLLERRRRHKREIHICHLNINSLQNKVEELNNLNLQLKAQVVILTETKIDKSYSNEQLAWTGYDILRQDRKKGGGGILMYVIETFNLRKSNHQENIRQ